MMSLDIFDFDSYYPEDDGCFSFLLSVRVGPKGDNTEESFDVEICTPAWLTHKFNEDEIILGKHKIIVFKYDREKIFSRIKGLFHGRTGETWQEIAIKLSRIGHWEFEDYREFQR